MPTIDQVTSIHEAGHAVSDIFHGLTFKSVTLDDAEIGPHVEGEVYNKPVNPLAPTVTEMDWIERQARATYAAHWAEKKAFGLDHRSGDRGDTENANKFAQDYIPGPVDRTPWLSRQFYAAQDDVEDLMPAIQAVADALVQNRTMTYEEIVSICRPLLPARS